VFAAIHAPENPAGLLDCAQTFSPLVEQTTGNTVLLDVSGLDRIFGLPQEIAGTIARHAEQCGLRASVAVAANPDAAFCAARGFAGVSVIPYGDEAKFLASLPVSLLFPSPELAETLERWGIRRFRDLAGLPEIGLAERLGPEGVRLRTLARGAAERPLKPLEETLRVIEEMELEDPLELLEPFLFLLARLLQGLCARLAARGMATNELRLRLRLEDRTEHARTLRLPVPMLDPKAFLKLLQLDLSAHPPAAPIVRVWLEAQPAPPRTAQHGLFVPLAPEPEKLELTLARVSALVGEENVGSPELVDTHRPGAFRMRRFEAGKSAGVRIRDARHLGFRVFRPPRPVRVRLTAGRPVYVQAEEIRGEVAAWAGPWRSSGDWWRGDPWARDEWDVALGGGAVYRIYCERHCWFLEGSYD
jgi:protein ImuB